MWNVYLGGIPVFLEELAGTPAMLRLQGVGMHCGCEYASFARYAHARPYSRWVHSVGVGLLVWRFTGDRAQAAAGLLHDVATPTFAHAVDFLRGDHLAQESTEADTEAVIAGSPELVRVLQRHGLTVGEVADYHVYPVADNDSPRLSADRLEYTLGNAYGHGMAGLDELRRLCDDLVVADDGEGQPELQFRSEGCALRFAELSLANSRIYISDENRFAMQSLAELLRAGLAAGVIVEADLHTTEAEVIRKLCADGGLRARWERFTGCARVTKSDAPLGEGWYKVDAKRRYIDPRVAGGGRATSLSREYAEALEIFLNQSLDHWVGRM